MSRTFPIRHRRPIGRSYVRLMSFLLPMLLTGALFTSSAAQTPPGPSATAFTGVNVIPMDGERVMENQTVIVRDGRIAELGPASTVQVPADAQRIDGSGRYLIPGLAEMHAHIPSPQAEEQFGDEYIENVLFLYLAHGVTTVRGMLGHPLHLELRAQAERGELLSPHIITSGPSFNGNSVQSPAQAAQMVREQKQAGYDFLKLHPGLTRAEFDSIAAVADRERIRFAGHVSEDVGLERALEARQATIDHLDSYVQAMLREESAAANGGLFGSNLAEDVDATRMPQLVAATRAAGVWNVPTQSLLENLAGPEPAETMAARPEMRYMPASTIAQWIEAKKEFQADPNFSPEEGERFVELRHELIRALQEADAGLLLGSDAPQIFNVPGFAAHRELGMLVEAGLTPYQALATGTRNPAVFFDELQSWGTIEEGKRADLVLLEANPLEDISNTQRIAGVMMGGRWLPEAEIQRRLEEVAEEMRTR